LQQISLFFLGNLSSSPVCSNGVANADYPSFIKKRSAEFVKKASHDLQCEHMAGFWGDRGCVCDHRFGSTPCIQRDNVEGKGKFQEVVSTNPTMWQHGRIHCAFSLFDLIFIIFFFDHHKSSLIFSRFIVLLSRSADRQKSQIVDLKVVSCKKVFCVFLYDVIIKLQFCMPMPL
jgi:hypothetical protein